MTSGKGVNSMHYRFFDADMGLAYGALQALLPLDVAGTLCGDGCGGRLAARINLGADLGTGWFFLHAARWLFPIS